MTTPKVLLPLTTPPTDSPEAWSDAATAGRDAVAVIQLPLESDTTALAAGIEALVRAGVEPLGHVSLAFATRALPEVLHDITRWAVLPVLGIFLDHAPASPYQIGPVVHAVRACRRCGLGTVVLNPGGPVDPVYRRLGVTICTFEGSWSEYAATDPDEVAAGDGHLVFDVPRSQWDAARSLSHTRQAGLALVTDRQIPRPR